MLDFGLAKAVEPGANAPPGESLLKPSPMQSGAPTQGGVMLGTGAYMSPEQAKGLPADKRSDIWSFGCVLYEMLTGTRAFEGEDFTDTVACVLRTEPNWAALPADLPAPIRALVRDCLVKERNDRAIDSSVALYVLKNAATLADAPVSNAAAPRRLATIAGAAAIAALTAGVATWLAVRPAPEPPRAVTRFSIPLEGEVYAGLDAVEVALSPDGTRVVSRAEGGPLYARALDRLDQTPLRGTEGARDVFFSPDSEWFGFWQNGQLKRALFGGGVPVVIADTEAPWGASWDESGIILLGQGRAGIARVSADGGAPGVVVSDPGRLARDPQMLPGGRAILFTSAPTSFNWDEAQIVAYSLDTGERHVLIEGASNARYVSTGHVVYVAAGTLFARRFDARALRVTSGALPLVESVARQQGGNTFGKAYFSISEAGSLAYVAELPTSTALRKLVWVDREGKKIRSTRGPGSTRTPVCRLTGRKLPSTSAMRTVTSGSILLPPTYSFVSLRKAA